MPSARDWPEWAATDDPTSEIAQRLPVVREQIRLAVASAPRGPIRVVSLCAGDGRDLLGALTEHPRRAGVTARLVELDPVIAGWGRAKAWPGLSYVVGDAALTDKLHRRGPGRPTPASSGSSSPRRNTRTASGCIG